MPRAEFEEKEYEQLAGVELAERGEGEGSALLFPAGQVLEHVLGYDTAADPVAGSTLWRVLQVPRPPGVCLTPGIWHRRRSPLPHQLPIHPVSLILQYKRPEFLRGGRASQWKLWYQPYFRFRRTSEQHAVLRRIESQLGNDVVVRYAAAAFWRRWELEAAHYERQVLERSGFVSPSSLGRHPVWTYLQPGVLGRPNPHGRPQEFATLHDLLGLLVDRLPPVIVQAGRSIDLVDADPIGSHFARIAAAVRNRQPGLRRGVNEWSRAVRLMIPELGYSQMALLIDYATTASFLGTFSASWHLAYKSMSQSDVTPGSQNPDAY